MDYEYDIFISYIRDGETKLWMEKHFLPILKQNLRFELGYNPEIFVDNQIQTGSTWPTTLGDKISKSKILIALWTKTYLHSEWCAFEISHMLKREVTNGYRQGQNENGLVIPIIVHDGETLPPALLIGQYLDIKEFFNSRMSIDSPLAEKLADSLKIASAGIAKQIENSPKWNQDWNIDAKNEFFNQYYKNSTPSQSLIPKFN